MKYVITVIPRDRLNEVLEDLEDHHIRMLNVCPVMGYYKAGVEADVYCGHKEVGRLMQKLKLEIAVDDGAVAGIIAEIRNRLRSKGGPFQGEIFIGNMEMVMEQTRPTFQESATAAHPYNTQGE